jgi:putative membrane protein
MKKYFLKMLVNGLGVVIASYILHGVSVEHFGYAVLVAFTLSVLNSSLRPLLILFTLPVTIFSLGLFILVINTAMIMLASHIIGHGFMIDGWWTAFLFSILLSLLNSILERFINTDSLAPAPKKEDDSMKIFDKDGNRVV